MNYIASLSVTVCWFYSPHAFEPFSLELGLCFEIVEYAKWGQQFELHLAHQGEILSVILRMTRNQQISGKISDKKASYLILEP